MIPAELKNLNSWIITKPDKIKRPVSSPTAAGFSLEYIQNKFPTRGFGLNSKIDDPFIIIDFDDVFDTNGNLNPDVEQFLNEYPTYTTLSISGKGLHAIYKTDIDKQKFKHYIPYKLGKAHGEIRISNCFTLFAKDQESLKVFKNHDTVSTIKSDILKKVFNIKAKSEKVAKRKDILAEKIEQPESLSLALVTEMLNMLPLDKSERIQKVYKDLIGEDYSHYQYWLLIGMSVHYCGASLNKLDHAFRIYLSWSKTDTESFVSEEDVKEHWQSFSSEDGITSRTLYAFYQRFKIWWPEVITRGGRLIPVQSSILNIKAVIDYEDITFKENVMAPTMFKVDGYKETLEKYFYTTQYYYNLEAGGEIRMPGTIPYDELVPGIALMCRERGLKQVKHVNIREAMDEILLTSQKYNPFKELIESVKPDFKKDTWKDVAQTLKIRKEFEQWTPLYYQMVRFWLTQIVKNIYYKGNYDRDAGILLIQGGANTYKTTWIESILPTPFNLTSIARNANVIDKKGVDKDTILTMKQKLILNFDEFENYLQSKGAASQLKSFMTGRIDSVRGLYERSPKSFKRTAVIGGTSNIDNMPLPFFGIRRYWIIPIEQCDTIKLNEIDLAQVYANIAAELKAYPKSRQHLLWNPQPLMLSFVETNARKFKLAEKLETMLEKVYNWDYPFKEWAPYIKSPSAKPSPMSKGFRTVRDIAADLEETFPTFDLNSIPDCLKSIKKIMHVKCSEYTHTTQKSKTLPRTRKWKILEGMGRCQGRSALYFVTPPLRKESDEIDLDIDPGQSEVFEDVAAILQEFEEFDRTHQSYNYNGDPLPSILI